MKPRLMRTADDTDDNLDADIDGIYNTDDEEITDNGPQELSQSYGTGLRGRPMMRCTTPQRQTF